MSSEYQTIIERIDELLRSGQSEGWLSPLAVEQLESIERSAPQDLFTSEGSRPLVVAFFGGTGAGKSSLLNRLADADVARVGVERPTSREVTLYVHRDIELAEFPQNLPLESVRVSRHGDACRADVMWVDMPDIDSTELSNRTAALAWLPHVDLVIYVVSPERYRDDAGWRVLLERGHRHGWMFVMNRWDEGAAAQRDDFKRILRRAGFEDPLVLATSCLSDAKLPTADEFSQIEHSLRELLDAYGLHELERLGQRARLDAIRQALRTAADSLGSDEQWESVRSAAAEHWQALCDVAHDGLAWQMNVIASRMADDPKTRNIRQVVLDNVLSRETEAPPAEPRPESESVLSEAAKLWDDWAQQKLTRRLDAVESAADRAGLNVPRLNILTDDLANTAAGTIRTAIEDAVREALARPGTWMQRMGRRVTGFLMTALPGVALLWVAWTLMKQYANAATGQVPYPGGNFAIASLLLIGLSWAIPFWLDRQLKPSLQRAVHQALQNGLDVGLMLVGEKLDNAIARLISQAADQRMILERMTKEIAGVMVRPIRADRPEVGRLISTKPLQEAG
jgi:hypothetical protein